MVLTRQSKLFFLFKSSIPCQFYGKIPNPRAFKNVLSTRKINVRNEGFLTFYSSGLVSIGLEKIENIWESLLLLRTSPVKALKSPGISQMIMITDEEQHTQLPSIPIFFSSLGTMASFHASSLPTISSNFSLMPTRE